MPFSLIFAGLLLLGMVFYMAWIVSDCCDIIDDCHKSIKEIRKIKGFDK